jgi:hypothetical protein
VISLLKLLGRCRMSLSAGGKSFSGLHSIH